MKVGEVLSDAGRTVSYHPNLVRALGSMPAAVMLSQLLYWTGKEGDTEGWIHKVEAEWDEELAFTPQRLKTARSVLVDLGLIEHSRRGLPARPCYRVNMDALEEWWTNYFHPPIKTGGKQPDRTGGKQPDRTGGKQPDIPLSPEMTTEMTTTPTSTTPGTSEKLCTLLANLVEANGSKRPTITKRWLEEADRLVRLDHHSPVEIAETLRWCQADPFWRANVMSMVKFRERYDQLRLLMKRPPPAPKSTNTMADALAEYKKQQKGDRT